MSDLANLGDRFITVDNLKLHRLDWDSKQMPVPVLIDGRRPELNTPLISQELQRKYEEYDELHNSFDKLHKKMGNLHSSQCWGETIGLVEFSRYERQR